MAYLRWIYVNGDIVGKGIGTKCMNSLKAYLYEKGVKRFDTDTALANTVDSIIMRKMLLTGRVLQRVIINCELGN